MWRSQCLSLSGSNVDKLTSFLAFSEHYYAIDESVDGVVLAHTYVKTGMVLSTALTLDDVAGFAALTTENLHSESFAF